MLASTARAVSLTDAGTGQLVRIYCGFDGMDYLAVLPAPCGWSLVIRHAEPDVLVTESVEDIERLVRLARVGT